jgi:hypothetical protein
VEVESSDQVHDEIARLGGDGLVTEEQLGNNCCYATQDKVWVTGPAGERWEVYTVLADIKAFATQPESLAAGETSVCSCATGDGSTDDRPRSTIG